MRAPADMAGARCPGEPGHERRGSERCGPVGGSIRQTISIPNPGASFSVGGGGFIRSTQQDGFLCRVDRRGCVEVSVVVAD